MTKWRRTRDGVVPRDDEVSMSDLASQLFPVPPAPGAEAIIELARTNSTVYALYRRYQTGALDWEHCLIACVLALAEENGRQRDELHLLINMTRGTEFFSP